MIERLKNLARAGLALTLASALSSCGANRGAHARSALDELRRSASDSSNPELVGQWLALELIAEGGQAPRAAEARKRLDAIGRGAMLANLARGIDDAAHGRMRSAPDYFLRSAEAARTSTDPRAPMIAWFAIRQALAQQDSAPDLWKRWKPFVEKSMREPQNLGWRARSELVEWWSDEAYAEATKDVDKLAAEHFGCVNALRLAGPFGHGAGRDASRHFPAEAPGPWPMHWPIEEGMGEAPRVLKTKQAGCLVSSDEPVNSGVFYVESFLELPQERDVIVAIQGALAVWIDDRQVLERDPRDWGVWPKFGARMKLGSGRHRVLARLADSVTSVRVTQPDGRPLTVVSSRDPSGGYSLPAPLLGADPNILDRYIAPGGVIDPKDDLVRFVGAYLANLEGQGDLASVWLEPLVAHPERATGVSLSLAAALADNDPVFDPTTVRDLIRQLEERALKRDPHLWQPKLALALWEAERAGASSAVRQMRALAGEFPDVPAVLLALSRLYGELGWSAEHAQVIKQLAKRFPDNTEALSAASEVYEAEGQVKEADALAKRIRALDPDSEILFSRALEREDYATALAELRRLAKRRPDRKDLTERISDVLVRSGNQDEAWKKLQSAIQKTPRDERARLALADAEYANGDSGALRKALASAVQAGAPTSALKDALDLVDGMSEFEPYRMPALSVIKAYEKTGKHMPGTAARVLDYAAVWVRSDGSSRMLEHEIVRIQSAESISELSEHPRLEGLVLHMRVIKKDGRIFEPEIVANKPTVTFPHLEVGDYIETEHITSQAGDGRYGEQYAGPQWFFREENVAYARSEFVVIAPKDKPLVIETRGKVPAPIVTDEGAVTIRRWRVDESPAAPNEPGSAPVQEFLPSVRIGWGISLERRMRALADTVADITPMDPRIVRIAARIVEPLPANAKAERARRLYRWIVSNVEDGPESDGRRVVTSKRGNRWRGLLTLCRALGIDAQYAVAENRLASPPLGALSRASLFTEPLMRLTTETGPVWLTLNSKYAPFGYVPAEVRGMPAYVLYAEQPRVVTTPSGGAPDSIVYEGAGTLAADGSARLDLVQRFYGKYATGLRSGLAEVPERQLHDVLESRLLARNLRGARLVSYKVEQLDQLDAPLTLRLTVEVPTFAQSSGTRLILTPPFSPRISQLATLPTRQTPLLFADATHQEVRLKLALPPGARVETPPGNVRVADADRSVTVRDKLDRGALIIERVLDLPAGRVQPTDYAKFAQFARRADDALSSSIRISLAH